ncbi:hypothetical protein OG749_02285 [Streptomyces nojiriensis]|uniref:hypothetical protein n=1 Tax=Streptomyces nojiriensis TaxID=66374 RepID=UPI002E17B4D3
MHQGNSRVFFGSSERSPGRAGDWRTDLFDNLFQNYNLSCQAGSLCEVQELRACPEPAHQWPDSEAVAGCDAEMLHGAVGIEANTPSVARLRATPAEQLPANAGSSCDRRCAGTDTATALESGLCAWQTEN